MAETILLIEDDFKMRRIIKDYLFRSAFQVLEAEDGEEGLDLFRANDISLVILDVMMPRLDGWSVCRELKRESTAPIIMLTARGEESDELFGFELGVDDYISKPFNPQILVARVKALLKRAAGSEEQFSCGGLIIDFKRCDVKLNGAPVELSRTEYELLVYLAENRGNVLSREQIINRVWGAAYYGDFRVVDTNVKRLRAKLESRFILTRRGFGYSFDEND